MIDSRSGFRWSNYEDEIIKEFVRRKGHVKPKPEEWVILANDSFGGKRSVDQLLNRWTYVIEPGITKGPWTYEEDQIIISSKMAGINKWSEISKQLPGRAGKQIRERWQNHLDPDLKKSRWTIEEDITLFQSQARYGNHWNLITSSLPGRSENSIKNRWHSASFKKNIANITSSPMNHFDSDSCRNPFYNNNQDISTTATSTTTISTTTGSVSSTENNDDNGTTNLLRLTDKRKSMSRLFTDRNSNDMDKDKIEEGGDRIRYMTRSLSLKSLPYLPSCRKTKQNPKSKIQRQHATEYTQQDNVTHSCKSVREYFRSVCSSVSSSYSHSHSQHPWQTKSRSRSSSNSNSRRNGYGHSIATYLTPNSLACPNASNVNEMSLYCQPMTPLATGVAEGGYYQNDTSEPDLLQQALPNHPPISMVKSRKFHSLQDCIELFTSTGNNNSSSIHNNNSSNSSDPSSDRAAVTTTTTTTSLLHISPMNKPKSPSQPSSPSQWPSEESEVERGMIRVFDTHNHKEARCNENIGGNNYDMGGEEEEDDDAYLLDFQIQSGGSFSIDMLSVEMDNPDKGLPVIDKDAAVTTTAAAAAAADDDLSYSIGTTVDSTFNGWGDDARVTDSNRGFFYTNSTVDDVDISCNISKNSSSSDFQFLSLSLSQSIDDDLKGEGEGAGIVSVVAGDGGHGDGDGDGDGDLYGKLDTSSSMLSRDVSEVELRDYFNNKWSAEDLRLLTFEDDDDTQPFFF